MGLTWRLGLGRLDFLKEGPVGLFIGWIFRLITIQRAVVPVLVNIRRDLRGNPPFSDLYFLNIQPLPIQLLLIINKFTRLLDRILVQRVT